MSALATRLTDLVAAIGADIKTLNNKFTSGGASLSAVYVTNDWISDPNNPDNGGSLASGIVVIEV